MKTNLRSLATALVAASTLWLGNLPSRAQDTVISAAEFQRMVYSGHLLTVLDAKPELDASLQVLLELQRRNPNAAPAALVDVTRQALQRYRTNAPAYIRINGFRDEILAAYLDALRQVPARTNFVPANLSLLHNLVTRAPAPTGEPQADLVHSGSRLVLSGENDVTERQALMDTCTARAQGNADFAAAMDSLLVPTETSVSLADSPAAIIGNTNSALFGNYTMQTLLALSLASGNGSLTVSSNQLINLFTNETQTLWTAIQTNLSLQAEINQGQPDLLIYLTNQTALDADALRISAVRQGQARTLASSTAAILIQSKLATGRGQSGKPSKLPKYADGLFKIVKGVAALTAGTPQKPLSLSAKAEGVFNIVSGAYSIFGLATEEPSESPEEEMVREIGNVKTLIQDLSANQNYRFNRVDQSLVTIFDTLNTEFDKIEITLGAQGQQIAYLTDNVNNIRLSLLDVQTDLNRIERNLATFAALNWRYDLLEDMNLGLGYEGRVGNPMQYQNLVPSFVGMENAFYTHAFNRATSETLSRYNTLPFSGADISEQLSPGGATNVYAETLNYIKKHLRVTLGLVSAFPEPPILANPQDWNAGAGAWLQLAIENPTHFRQYAGATSRLDNIINNGRDLTNFFRSLIFAGSSGTNINGPLYNALTNYYANNLPPFLTQVQATEQQYATSNNFALNIWRQWSAAAPRVTATATELLIAPEPLPPIPRAVATRISCGLNHSLAVKSDGTVVAWGFNGNGQINVPPGLNNVVAVAGGGYHSLALKGDGTVVGWGFNGNGETTPPSSATNVMAIAAGVSHNLALRANGTVVGWGENTYGQTNSSASATNVIAIAVGGQHSLALRSDGAVVAWGAGTNNSGAFFQYGQAIVPPGLAGVTEVAGGVWHSLALKQDGTVVAWGHNVFGQTNVPPSATNVMAIAAGSFHSLVLQSNGTVVGWGGLGQAPTKIPIGLTNVIAIAAGDSHSLALKADDTVVVWGDISLRQCVVPPALTWRGAIAPGASHMLALKANGTLLAWGDNTYGQTNIPPTATNVVAIAAGDNHNLALKANGTIVGWGYNSRRVLEIPASATNVVAITAGAYHSLALKADGTVVGWGDDFDGYPVDNIPPGLNNVVAIAAGGFGSTSGHGLALKADGTVVGWGNNDYGQTNVPPGAINVIAIAAGDAHSLALRADGSVVAWGAGLTSLPNGGPWGVEAGQSIVPVDATNVVAIAAGNAYSLFLKSSSSSTAGQNLSLVRAQIPRRVGNLFQSVNSTLLATLQPFGSSSTNAFALSGPKALLTAVLELGLPYTLERDDVLHGFLYGNESLVDLTTAQTFLQDENEKLQASPETMPQTLGQVAVLRNQRFVERLNQRLLDLQATGQPEIPRLVGHTLRLLNLLRDSWNATPPSSLEIGSKTNGVGLVLYGEPYARYSVQQSSNLANPTSWTNTSITDLRSADSPLGTVTTILPITGEPACYYRAAQPVP